jgi:hypothetical protein
VRAERPPSGFRRCTVTDRRSCLTSTTLWIDVTAA